MALSNALSTLGEPIFENLHARLSSEIAKWKPSLTALTFENWYNNHKYGYKHEFGEFDQLDEIYLDVFQQSFIEENFKDDL
jgi:N-acetyl-anhydromuramyl-L-alanine amidase AmpD